MLAAIVTLFHPTKDQLENLRKLSSLPNLDLIILVQNSDEDLSFLNIPKSILIKNDNVGGIAGAFNRGAHAAFQTGADTVVLLDQDSEVPADFFSRMLNFMKNQNADMAAPDFMDINSKTKGTYFQFGFWKLKRQPSRGNIRSHVAISSGTFLSKKTFEKVGLFREDLAIDHVDTDFNFRAYLLGMSIYINRDLTLEHAIGARSSHRIFGVLLIKPTHHSPLRRYYRIRNGTNLALHHFIDSPAYSWLIVKWSIHDILGILFYEEKKLEKMKATLIGIWHGIIGQMGVSKSKF